MTIEKVDSSYLTNNYNMHHNRTVISHNSHNNENQIQNEVAFNYNNFDDEQIKELEKIANTAAKELNKLADVFNRTVKFIVHNESGRIKTEVINTETKEIIREIPSEEILDMVSKLKSYVGTIIDEKF